MAAGLTQIAVKDGGGTSRNVNQWSSDGTTAGNLVALRFEFAVIEDRLHGTALHDMHDAAWLFTAAALR